MAHLPKNASKDDPLQLHHEYNQLSLPDLLLARERNHIELMRKENVIGTAVGLYLIRRDDPWPPQRAPKNRKARTLPNSEVRPYSWPCILVFVEKWDEEKNISWEDMVPSSLYLDDGRRVPVCVVEAPPIMKGEPIMRNVVFPSTRMGGGFPVVAEVQGREHVASIGCLLTDGHTTYALTNRHVTGEPGEVVYTKIGGASQRLGVSSKKQLTRKPFREIYDGWPGRALYLTLDIGLIQLDDISNWTAQVFGIGTVDKVADLGIDNLSLRLIDCPVRAYGCASGLLQGQIKALFYRYRSMGGFEYVSDFLIGARNEAEPFQTHPGDSGTLWLLETGEALRPLAVQWGGTLFSDDSGKPQVSCALATCLSTVCNLLDVDVIRDWNEGSFEYWGETGHYTIGALACTLTFTSLPGLEKLMSQNIDRVGFEPAILKQNEKVLRSKAGYEFVPLADVADDVWRNTRKSDENNHFADMDQPAGSGPFKGKTLLDICQDDPDKNIDPQVWKDFYATIPGTNPGALPFRVWQIYQEMVNYATAGDAAHFLCAAGCLAHYIGDACQPLHISRLHHGNPPLKKGTVPYQVHAVYETQMLNAKATEIVDGVVDRLKHKSVAANFTGGFGAARRVIELMEGTVTKLPPADIVKTYNDAKTKADRLTDLWDAHGDATMDVIADGCLCLAEVWASAWSEGGGESIAKTELGPVDFDTLEGFYNDKDFLPSVGLGQLITILKKSTGGPALLPRKTSGTAKSTNGKKHKKRTRHIA